MDDTITQKYLRHLYSPRKQYVSKLFDVLEDYLKFSDYWYMKQVQQFFSSQFGDLPM